jgi:hypothetical protein
VPIQYSRDSAKLGPSEYTNAVLRRAVSLWNPRLHRGTSRALFGFGVKLSTNSKRSRNLNRFLAVEVMLTLWVWMCALEVSPELHHFLHKDAQSPAHNCLVTQFQHHSLHPGCAPLLLPARPTEWSPLIAQNYFLVPPSFDYRLSPSRAPPSA